jgi:hypothetical protein
VPRQEAPERRHHRCDLARQHIWRHGGEAIQVSATWDAKTMHARRRVFGNIAPAYSFAAQAVEVEVDTDTGQVTVIDSFVSDDCGKALNPMAVHGQTNGATVQAFGWALYEQLQLEAGRIANGNFADYTMPTADAVPMLRGGFVESNDPNGPYGAKGASETAILPGAPAIANAVFDAIGVRIVDLPITPEKILAALRAQKEAAMRDFDFLQPVSVSEAPHAGRPGRRMPRDRGRHRADAGDAPAHAHAHAPRLAGQAAEPEAASAFDEAQRPAHRRAHAARRGRALAARAGALPDAGRAWPRAWPIRRCATRAPSAGTSAMPIPRPTRPAASWRWMPGGAYRHARGDRVLGIEEFLVDYYTTALEPDELLSEIRIAPPQPGTTGVYSRFLRTAAEHRPLASVACWARAAARAASRTDRGRRLGADPTAVETGGSLSRRKAKSRPSGRRSGRHRGRRHRAGVRPARRGRIPARDGARHRPAHPAPCSGSRTRKKETS